MVAVLSNRDMMPEPLPRMDQLEGSDPRVSEVGRSRWPGSTTAGADGSGSPHDASPSVAPVIRRIDQEAAPRPLVMQVIIAGRSRLLADLLGHQLQARWRAPTLKHCGSAEEVLACLATQPDALVISDVPLEDGTVLALAEQLMCPGDPVRLAILTDVMPDLLLDRLLLLPILGCWLTTDSAENLLEGLERIARGQRCFSPVLQQRFLEASRPGQEDQRPAAVLKQLTPRQMDVLIQLAEGQSVKQVAQRLRLSTKAIDSLKYRLMKLLEFHDRVELTRFAIREGLIRA